MQRHSKCENEANNLSKAVFAGQFPWAIGAACFRLSILVLNIEMFPVSGFFRCTAATAVAVVLNSLMTILVLCLSCRPIESIWDQSLKAHCDLTHVSTVIISVLNTLLDTWVVCLPLLIVWRLQPSIPKKIAISATFALGLW